MVYPIKGISSDEVAVIHGSTGFVREIILNKTTELMVFSPMNDRKKTTIWVNYTSLAAAIERYLKIYFYKMASTYCSFVQGPGKDTVHREYHDKEYGFPLKSDNDLFARLILEINQAGLSWETILKKKENFFKAFDNFDIDKVARYTDKRREKLMQNAGIIRNKLKINATIENAKAIKAIQKEYGSFAQWLDSHHPKTKDEWVKIFKENFRFTGGEIVNEFLMSIGYLPGAHSEDCPIYKKVMKLKPKWASTTRQKAMAK